MLEASLPTVTRPTLSSGSEGKYVTDERMYAAELRVDAALPEPDDPSVVMFMSSESDSSVLKEFLSRRLCGDFPARRPFVTPSCDAALFNGRGVMNEASGVDVVEDDCDADDEIGNVTPPDV